MSVMSGKWGVVNVSAAAVSTVRNWRLSTSSEPKTFIASNTKGGTGRRPAVLDWSGNYQQYAKIPTVMPGSGGLFAGYVGPTNGTPGTAGPIMSGTFICENIQVVINWGGAELITITTNFLGNDILTRSEGVVAFDTSIPSVFPSGLGKFEIAKAIATPVYSAICSTQATLNILAQMLPYSDSCTYDATKGMMIRKRVSGAIDWNLSVVCDDIASFVSPPVVVGDLVLVKLWVDTTNFWDLKYGIVENVSDFTVDRETGALISYTLNISMCADNGTIMGSITLPGAGTPWWPVTGASLLEVEE